MTKTFIILIFSIIVSDAFCQNSKVTPSLTCSDSINTYRREWVNIGIGNSTDNLFNSIHGATIGVDYHWMPKHITYQAGFSATTQMISGPTLNVINAGLGKSWMNRRFLFSMIGGAGVMWGKNYEDDTIDGAHFVKAGFKADATVIIKLIKNFGIGFELYTILNEVQNASGVRFVIHLNNNK